MQQTRAVEIGTGLFVFLGIVALFFLTTRVTNFDSYEGDEGYTLTARFDNIGTLKLRSPVSMSGVKVGRVSSIVFDDEMLEAVVELRIDAHYSKIPNDSDASILTQGILGGQYIGLEAGGSEEFFVDQDEIQFTQSALVLEKLVSKYLFSRGDKEDK
ncbi:MAG: outer membrane lipid asymmetry maintenance protein MlaD [Chromatiales bacterium]|jgi:phospholipid/cholesterol/gamma-HCH transport system substrate-binding protein|nr:outer membrane lipid asymmetry maintenance protein MlaD [Chromatiales bacterium]